MEIAYGIRQGYTIKEWHEFAGLGDQQFVLAMINLAKGRSGRVRGDEKWVRFLDTTGALERHFR